VLLSAFAGSAWAVTLPFEDDFENIAVGDYPNENGWQVRFSGKSAYVSDEVAHSGSKSFRLDSHPNWAHQDYVYLGDFPDRITYEVSVYIHPTLGRYAIVGLSEKVGNQGPSWNSFEVDGAGGTVWFVGMEPLNVSSYVPGTWCTLRADLDFESLKGNVWVDGEVVAENVDIKPREFDHPFYGHIVLEKWGVASHNYPSSYSSNVVYFDDVRIYETLEADVDLDPDTLNLRSRGRPITAYVELPEGYDAADIGRDSIRLHFEGAPEEGIAIDPRYRARIGDEDADGIPDLMVKFDRQLVQSYLEPGTVEMTILGELTDGTLFEGTDTVRVINPGRG